MLLFTKKPPSTPKRQEKRLGGLRDEASHCLFWRLSCYQHLSNDHSREWLWCGGGNGDDEIMVYVNSEGV